MAGVHALTDVTGFGLAGHTLEVARGAGMTAVVEWSRVPVLPGVTEMAVGGFVTGASARNWAGYGAEVQLDEGLPARARDLVTDPQTSGGLLVACAPDRVDAVLALFRVDGFAEAARVGTMAEGVPGLRIAA